MTVEPQFVEERIEGDEPPEPAQHTSGRRWLGAVLVLLLAAIAAVVLVHQPQANRKPTAGASTSTSPPPSDPPDQTLLAVYSLGRDPAAAHDIVRGESTPGFCRTVRVGTVPQRTAANALERILAGFRVFDTARIIDQAAGLCALQVRARDEQGNVVLANVVSPSPGRRPGRRQELQAHSGVLHATAVEYAEFTTRDGWVVVVGSSGPRSSQPAVAALGRVASDPAMRW